MMFYKGYIEEFLRRGFDSSSSCLFSEYARILSVIFSEIVCEFLIRSLRELRFLPHIRCQVGVGSRNGSIRSHSEVAHRRSCSIGGGVAIVDTSHLQQLLGDTRSNNSSSTGGRNQPHIYRSTFTSHLAGHGVRFTDLVSPVSSTNWNDGQLGLDDSTTNGSGYLLGAFHTKTHMTIKVSDGNKSLEACSLSSTGLLLHRHDLENLVFQ